ncbi:hypothetical protein CAPTEDRAFT_184543 [Capitella teleta]|uniref:3-oxoacyl-[acyl-carrier-protein] synthase n=1 Tax=Capitella teleta TaxID=283909 RepID=R7U470_CAPTE|nr:hypothetical protein CAPTEDRAFT_184543 [Capitella teleta]|eukprot:ELT97960.1 hypothetical protein CAPTEDRAFT_184543 [Capitella teleta]
MIRNLSKRAYCSMPDPRKRRVVVTGMGLVTCLGVGVDHVWGKLIKGKSGIHGLPGEEFAQLPSRVGASVPRGEGEGQYEVDRFVDKAERRAASVEAGFALAAADEALRKAAWKPVSEEDSCRTGVSVGCGMAGMHDVIDNGVAFATKGYRKVSPFLVPRILVNMPAGMITFKHGLKGVNHAVSTACATGVHSVGDAYRFIKFGDADVMVAGGTEASVLPYYMAAFCRLRALSTQYNDDPLSASRPFDQGRDGFVMSEGAAVLVLEDLQHAQARGVAILGEILGYGLSADAHHVTAPLESGEGGVRCMRAAMREAGVCAEDVGYINAHATSTPLGDLAESRAISLLFGEHTRSVAVSSTKGATGHLLGATGAAETVFSLLACSTGVIPPTLNCENPDDEINLNIVRSKAKKWHAHASGRRVALTNSFGFGGTNATLCVANFVE